KGFVMIRIRSMGRGVLIASAAMLLGLGCAAQPGPDPYARPPSAPAYPPSAYGYGEAPVEPVAPEAVESDVSYDAGPPVVDIETYPSVVYEGMPVYYVGGMWYRHDARGWGSYRTEPAELGRQRQQHGSDARWVRAGEQR